MPREEELLQQLREYASARGWNLNDDIEHVKTVVAALVENEKRTGLRLCPCRVQRHGEDIGKYVCPCAWHEEEIELFGKCRCGLFVKR